MSTIFQGHCLLIWNPESLIVFRTVNTGIYTITRMCLLRIMVEELETTGRVGTIRLAVNLKPEPYIRLNLAEFSSRLTTAAQIAHKMEVVTLDRMLCLID